MKNTTFVGACREFFGQRPGQTLQEFGEELKALSNEDRHALATMFPSVGYTIDPSTIEKKVAATA